MVFVVIIIAIAIVLIFLLAILIFNKSIVLGKVGEIKHAIILNKIKNAIVINNVMLKLPDGKTIQIDHVLINHYGIFVIESKNYSGRIYGNIEQSQWTQVFNYGNTKYYFGNPLFQNEGHINAIKEVLPKEMTVECVGVVVFTNSAELMLEGINNVIQTKNLKNYINSFDQINLTTEVVNSIARHLKQLSEVMNVSNREHIANVEERLEKCPICGSPLVIRSGQYGDFYGCGNYPKCRYTRKK